jgi:hypothetical protein
MNGRFLVRCDSGLVDIRCVQVILGIILYTIDQSNQMFSSFFWYHVLQTRKQIAIPDTSSAFALNKWLCGKKTPINRRTMVQNISFRRKRVRVSELNGPSSPSEDASIHEHEIGTVIRFPSIDPNNLNPDSSDEKKHLLYYSVISHDVELFIATTKDVENRNSRRIGRHTIVAGTIGFRCIHCCNEPDPGAECACAFPGSVVAFYPSLNHFIRNHIFNCKFVPLTRINELKRLQATGYVSCIPRAMLVKYLNNSVGLYDDGGRVRYDPTRTTVAMSVTNSDIEFNPDIDVEVKQGKVPFRGGQRFYCNLIRIVSSYYNLFPSAASKIEVNVGSIRDLVLSKTRAELGCRFVRRNKGTGDGYVLCDDWVPKNRVQGELSRHARAITKGSIPTDCKDLLRLHLQKANKDQQYLKKLKSDSGALKRLMAELEVRCIQLFLFKNVLKKRLYT